MLETLELKYLAPYLPYKLKFLFVDRDIITMDGLKLNRLKKGETEVCWGSCIDELHKIKPILRPLSDLTKEIEHNGEKFVPKEWIIEYLDGSFDYGITLRYFEANNLTYHTWEKLFEWHFDVFGLIDKGLAIDINTYKRNKMSEETKGKILQIYLEAKQFLDKKQEEHFKQHGVYFDTDSKIAETMVEFYEYKTKK